MPIPVDTPSPATAPPATRTEAEAFAGRSGGYYADRFANIARYGVKGLSLNTAAVALGPLWAAMRGLWVMFWGVLVADVLGLTLAAQALVQPDDDGMNAGRLAAGATILVAGRLLAGIAGNLAYYRRYMRWRLDRAVDGGFSRVRAGLGSLLMLAIYPLVVYRFAWPEVPEFIEEFPTSRQIALTVANAIDAVVLWMTVNFAGAFDAITMTVRAILNAIEVVFVGTPWPVVGLVLILAAWRAAGARVAIFTGAGLLYLGLFGFWEKAMSTISLVAAAAVICIAVGLPVGIWCAKNDRVNAVFKPVLDFMQTMPSFVYLIPAIAFFSIGKPPAVLATVIFAMPPMIRLTTLGMQQVPASVKEATLAFGASPRQLLVKVELPLAAKSIMAGINQTIMMSLSMVVIAALIGAGGLGYDVLSALQRVQTGRGVLAGLAIVVCAMALDRVVQGNRTKQSN
ncbi:MAG TPA: proline/glycine betaine ABC transporter permease [Alphaproteobacteria bacterium]|nr:proline/glycine betaine ABC transporter permease [Alphaproteobacteria bacterium]